MKLVFMGTPQFAVPTLRLLHSSGYEITGVITQPDKPVGRGQQVTAPPIKQAAVELGLTVHQPPKIRTPEVFELLKSLQPDAIVIVGYGKIIPQPIIDLPRHGCINLHASLLPKYRGAAPVNWAIVRGEIVTGVTTMKIDAGLDTGDMLLRREIPIEPDDDAVTLGRKLAEMGAPLMVETLHGLEARTITAIPQDNSQATLAPILKKEDGLIDWSIPARDVANRVRGLVPWPGAYTRFRGGTLQVWKCGVRNADCGMAELRVEGRSLLVGCSQGTLELIEIQLEGKRRMSAADFVNGARIQPGEELGS